MAPVVVDTHVHGPTFTPKAVLRLYRLVNRTTMPPELGFDVLPAAGVDAVVGKAVGDPIVTRWYRGDAWNAVHAQLLKLRDDIAAAGGVVVTDTAAIRHAKTAARPALLLGVEGADAIGDDVSRLDR